MSHPSELQSDRPTDTTTGRFITRAVVAADLTAIEALHDRVFGPGALARSAYRTREGQPAFTPFCRVMLNAKTLVSALRFTAIRIGGAPGALMLGPLAVAPEHANQGHGRRLVVEGLDAARAAGEVLVLLVGDAPYYARFGFVQAPRGQIQMPGPVDPARLLIAELTPGVAQRFHGRVAGGLYSPHRALRPLRPL